MKVAYDCYNHKLNTQGMVGTVVPQFSRMDYKHNGYKIIEIYENSIRMEQRKGL